MRKAMGFALVMLPLMMLASPAGALFYLPEKTLESQLVQADTVVIGTIAESDAEKDRATVNVREILKGEAGKQVVVSDISLRISKDKKKVRFKKDDRVLLFLQKGRGESLPINFSMVIETEADERSMTACIKEVMPYAEALANLENIKKDIDQKAVAKAIETLGASRNGHTQIVVGRLMGTAWAQRIKPEPFVKTIVAALTTGRTELKRGAIAWCAKFETLPADVRTALESIADNGKDQETAKQARKVLLTFSAAATQK